MEPVTLLVTLTSLVLVLAADDFDRGCRFMETLAILCMAALLKTAWGGGITSCLLSDARGAIFQNYV